ncbi:MAG: hypothetical protein ABSH06_26795 [Thermodesulfobacteriota bacterium]
MLRKEKFTLIILFCLGIPLTPIFSMGQEINQEGWPIPDLKGLTPYSITIQHVDGVEKIVEKFYTPSGGHVARVSGNGKVFAYAVDKDQEPPIDYLLIDPDGLGKFTQKFKSEDSYFIPEWVSQ